MPQALKSCPKRIKSPNLVTLYWRPVLATYPPLGDQKTAVAQLVERSLQKIPEVCRSNPVIAKNLY